MPETLSWRDYFSPAFTSVPGQEKTYNDRTACALDAIFDTEAGQRELATIAAAQKTADGKPVKIPLTNYRNEPCTVIPGESGDLARPQRVNINYEYLDKQEYLGLEDGMWHPASDIHMLVHELIGHIAGVERDEASAIAITNRILKEIGIKEPARVGHVGRHRPGAIDPATLPFAAEKLKAEDREAFDAMLSRETKLKAAEAPLNRARPEGAPRSNTIFVDGEYTLAPESAVLLRADGDAILNFAKARRLDLMKTSFAYFDVDGKKGLSAEEIGAAKAALRMVHYETGISQTQTTLLSVPDPLRERIAEKDGAFEKLKDREFRAQAVEVARQLVLDNVKGGSETTTPESVARFAVTMKNAGTLYGP